MNSRRDSVDRPIKNIKEVADNLLDNQFNDPWLTLSKQEMESTIMYVVMQYRMVMEHIDETTDQGEKDKESLLKAISKHQRLATRVFDHIQTSDINRRLF